PLVPNFLKNRCRKERELLLIWGPAPRPPGFFQGMGVYRPMRVKAGREAQLHAPFSSFDELTGLFLSAVASPQRRPPLHPLPSPYKPHDPAQVFFESDTTFLLLPRQSIEEFEKDLKNNLYRIWNRMSSGSYFPPAVLTVKIPKAKGGERTLGIPTVSD